MRDGGGGWGGGGSTGVQCWWDLYEEVAPSKRERERREKYREATRSEFWKLSENESLPRRSLWCVVKGSYQLSIFWIRIRGDIRYRKSTPRYQRYGGAGDSPIGYFRLSWWLPALWEVGSPFRLRTSPRIRIQNRKGYSNCLRDLYRTDLCLKSKNPSHWYVSLKNYDCTVDSRRVIVAG